MLLEEPPSKAGLLPLINIFNLGEPGNYPAPDGGLFRPGTDHVFEPTADLVVEIVSSDDETWGKLAFYAAHDVNELLIVDPQQREIHWLGLGPDGEYRPIERSSVLALGAAELAERINWPQ